MLCCVRYVLLSYCMAMRTVSFRVKKRFPDLQHLVDAGLMREDELKVRGQHCTLMIVSWDSLVLLKVRGLLYCSPAHS